MKTFFKQLLSSKSDTSSKRFSGFIALAACIILAFLAALCDKDTPEFMFLSLISFAAAVFGLTIFENKPKQDEKTEE